jgi:predicted esterase YcpF (UPF0227 family)
MILNVHGYNHEGKKNPGKNSVYQWLVANYDEKIVSFDIDYDNENPHNILERLRSEILLNKKERIKITGNSLGGFFAYSLHILYPAIPTVLFNPCLVPFLVMVKRIQRVFLIKYLDIFKDVVFEGIEPETNHRNLTVFLGTKDELIDHEKLTVPVLYPPSIEVIKINQGHRVTIDEEIAEKIKESLRGIER